MIKSIDKKFADIGFTKINEDIFGVRYERFDKEHNYTHVLAILTKSNGSHILQSYDKDSFSIDGIGNSCVGLTYREIKLALKKMKLMKYRRF